MPAADRRDAEWVRADLVGEVQYTERTEDGRLRHPVWRGWRPDKEAGEVGWEETDRSERDHHSVEKRGRRDVGRP